LGDVRPFDFRRPSTLKRDHVRTLQIVQETMARGFTTALAASLRAVVQVGLNDLEQCTYDEYIATVPNPTLLTTVALHSNRSVVMLEIPLRVGYAANELLLGGPGAEQQPDRPMTEVELGLVRVVVEGLLPEVQTALEPIVATEPSIVAQESNPQFAQLAAPNEMILVMAFDVQLEAVSDVIRVSIPFNHLIPHLESLDESELAPATEAIDQRTRVHAQLASAPVEISATFLPALATSRQLVGLRVGDVLMLPHSTSMPLVLHADGVGLYDVGFGRVNRRMAVQVQDLFRSGPMRRTNRIQIVPGE
jgi:flagellar motor switch protein FliM